MYPLDGSCLAIPDMTPFLSLEKDNMRPVSPMPLGFDSADPVNAGVISDELAGYGGGVMLRRITYRCPQSGRDLVFLTNLTFLRMQRACELLATTGDKIDTIAYQIGYASGAHFSNAFTKWVGIRPSEYREGRAGGGE